jgi:hypothetical protein
VKADLHRNWLMWLWRLTSPTTGCLQTGDPGKTTAWFSPTLKAKSKSRQTDRWCHFSPKVQNWASPGWQGQQPSPAGGGRDGATRLHSLCCTMGYLAGLSSCSFNPGGGCPCMRRTMHWARHCNSPSPQVAVDSPPVHATPLPGMSSLESACIFLGQAPPAPPEVFFFFFYFFKKKRLWPDGSSEEHLPFVL